LILHHVVYRFKDTIFWKQITTLVLIPNSGNSCLSVQRYNFLKANHNLIKKGVFSATVVYRFKDTIFWKQITTRRCICWRWSSLFIGSKIQFSESKSQPYGYGMEFFESCLSVQRYNFLKANHNRFNWQHGRSWVVYRFKDTIFWKQITTPLICPTAFAALFIGSKIQFSESKSQQRVAIAS